MERSNLLVMDERKRPSSKSWGHQAVKALGALAVAERDILGHFVPSDSARSDDATPSRAHLALSIHQETRYARLL